MHRWIPTKLGFNPPKPSVLPRRNPYFVPSHFGWRCGIQQLEKLGLDRFNRVIALVTFLFKGTSSVSGSVASLSFPVLNDFAGGKEDTVWLIPKTSSRYS